MTRSLMAVTNDRRELDVRIRSMRQEVDELIRTMYPHPTLNEAFPEAARAVQGRALNQ